MSYSVLQTGAETPTTEQLKRAFRGAPGLTEMDAYTIGKDAFGLIAKGFALEPAQALKNSLQAQGIAAEVVEERILPILPDSFFISRLDCTENALLLYDTLGRVAEVQWQDVLLVAAGTVRMTEFKQVHAPVGSGVQHGLEFMRAVADPPIGRRSFISDIARDSLANMPRLDVSTREEQHDRFTLEIILAGAVTRYTVKEDRMSQLFFQYLAERRDAEMSRNFRLLVHDLVQHSPDAAINRGAYYLKEDDATQFEYPSKVAFYNEIVWLLWRKSLTPPTV
jgi:hypothetical protein